MGRPFGKIEGLYGIEEGRLSLAALPDEWTTELLATFASQFGSPQQYTLIQRARLLGAYGVMAYLVDVCQQAVLAPYAKRDKPPKSCIPGRKISKEPDVAAVSKDELDMLLGIGRK